MSGDPDKGPTYISRVYIDDTCDGCDITDRRGVSFGAGRPVLCYGCVLAAYGCVLAAVRTCLDVSETPAAPSAGLPKG